jgi:hypothetical protein
MMDTADRIALDLVEEMTGGSVFFLSGPQTQQAVSEDIFEESVKLGLNLTYDQVRKAVETHQIETHQINMLTTL